MNCPICNGDTRVLHTSGAKRRRECERCHHRFNTFEKTEEEVARAETVIEQAKTLAKALLDDDDNPYDLDRVPGLKNG